VLVLPLFFRTGAAEVTFYRHKLSPVLEPGWSGFFIAQTRTPAP
jgi:hypothetical protein